MQSVTLLPNAILPVDNAVELRKVRRLDGVLDHDLQQRQAASKSVTLRQHRTIVRVPVAGSVTQESLPPASSGEQSKDIVHHAVQVVDVPLVLVHCDSCRNTTCSTQNSGQFVAMRFDGT